MVACLNGLCTKRQLYKYCEDFGMLEPEPVERCMLSSAYIIYLASLNMLQPIQSVLTFYAGCCGCKLIYYGKGKNMTKKNLRNHFYQNISSEYRNSRTKIRNRRKVFLCFSSSQTEAFKKWSMKMLSQTPNAYERNCRADRMENSAERREFVGIHPGETRTLKRAKIRSNGKAHSLTESRPRLLESIVSELR